MKKLSSSVDERAKSATLPKGQNKTVPFVKRLQLTGLLKNSNLTNEEVDRLRSLSSEEEQWRGSFFNFLIGEGLLIELQKLPTEELREFVFMKKEEQETWTKKLADQKAQREQQEQPHESHPHGQQAQKQDKVQPLARSYKQGKDKITSMEVRMLPAVREYVDALAAHNGMLAQRFVEHLIVETINKDPDHVKHGQQLLKEHGGSLTRATRHAQEEELARLRAAVSTGSSPHR